MRCFPHRISPHRAGRGHRSGAAGDASDAGAGIGNLVRSVRSLHSEVRLGRCSLSRSLLSDSCPGDCRPVILQAGTDHVCGRSTGQPHQGLLSASGRRTGDCGPVASEKARRPAVGQGRHLPAGGAGRVDRCRAVSGKHSGISSAQQPDHRGLHRRSVARSSGRIDGFHARCGIRDSAGSSRLCDG